MMHSLVQRFNTFDIYFMSILICTFCVQQQYKCNATTNNNEIKTNNGNNNWCSNRRYVYKSKHLPTSNEHFYYVGDLSSMWSIVDCRLWISYFVISDFVSIFGLNFNLNFSLSHSFRNWIDYWIDTFVKWKSPPQLINPRKNHTLYNIIIFPIILLLNKCVIFSNL